MSAREFEPVFVGLPGAPDIRRITTAFEALECLSSDWPITTGPAYRRAVRASRDALDGVVRPTAARKALIAATEELRGMKSVAELRNGTDGRATPFVPEKAGGSHPASKDRRL